MYGGDKYYYDCENCLTDVNDANDNAIVSYKYFFMGRRLDPETSLYLCRARFHNPEIGRFLQADPLGYFAGLNLYTYVGNNPLNWLDPFGLCEKDKTKDTFHYHDLDEIEVLLGIRFRRWKLESAIATGLVWADVLDFTGLFGEFGRMDTFDMKYADTIINPYPYLGKPGDIADELYWDSWHYRAGAGFGYLGFDETIARTFMEVWEMTEPSLITVWGSRSDYQGRSFYKGGIFENSLAGIERDMKEGMAGYWYGWTLRD